MKTSISKKSIESYSNSHKIYIKKIMTRKKNVDFMSFVSKVSMNDPLSDELFPNTDGKLKIFMTG